MREIPNDIWVAAENALDNMLCHCRESSGSTEAYRRASVKEIASAILAEREACAARAEAKDREGREWVCDSLWGNVRREISADIRRGKR